MKAYSMDLRKRVLRMCDAGHGSTEVAEVLGVSPAWVRRLKQRRREDGSFTPRPCGGDRVSKLAGPTLAELRRFLQEQPDATLTQLQDRCLQELQVSCSVMAVWRALKKLRFSLKKSRCGRRSRTGRTSRDGVNTTASPAALRKSNASCSSTNRERRRT